MLPSSLVKEEVRRESGSSPVLEVSGLEALTLTLEISRIVEREGLELAVYGSSNGVDWDSQPLAVLPPKCYCGSYPLEIDLSRHPGVSHVKAAWRMARWGARDRQPLFAFQIRAEEPVLA